MFAARLLDAIEDDEGTTELEDEATTEPEDEGKTELASKEETMLDTGGLDTVWLVADLEPEDPPPPPQPEITTDTPSNSPYDNEDNLFIFFPNSSKC